MKRYLQQTVCLIVGSVSLFCASCKKDIVDRTLQYKALAPANLDLNADNWTPVLITDPSVFNVPAPDALTSPAYIADLNEIKGYQRNLTSDQKAIIKYWSAGSVLRWNQILRELVA
ncbi:MAG TPA: hypothetical protein VJ844_10560, partial [Mucilaginibacter sp.]|nr:hypothetical protein [Mucilaginibacter sp.]